MSIGGMFVRGMSVGGIVLVNLTDGGDLMVKLFNTTYHNQEGTDSVRFGIAMEYRQIISTRIQAIY